MTRKKTVGLIIAIGITMLIAAFLTLYSGAEEKTHEGARFVAAGYIL